MQTTLDLLAKATQVKTIPQWTAELGLSQKALYTAKDRGHTRITYIRHITP